MNLLWDETDSGKSGGEPGPLVYAARLLAREETLGVFGGGNASVKLNLQNIFGETEEVLYIDHGEQEPAALDTRGFTLVHRKPLQKLAGLHEPTADQLENELACSRVKAAAPLPPVDALLHAFLPFRYILTAQPDAVFAVANTPGGQERLSQIFGESVKVLPYAPSGLELAQACAAALPPTPEIGVEGIFIMQQRLLTFGETARVAYERMIELVSRAERYLEQHGAWSIPQPGPRPVENTIRQDLAARRKAISMAAGCPLILSVQTDPLSLGFCRRDDLARLTQRGPISARHVAVTKYLPMIGRDVSAYEAIFIESYRASCMEDVPARADPAPRIILDPDFGLGALGRTAGEAALAGKIYHHSIETILRATALEEYRSLSPRECFAAEIAAYPAPADTRSAARPFTGEIALVTGGASGIGKGCVQSLLARGAAVVSLDVNLAVKDLFSQPDYLGLVCDLTDEAAVMQAFETFTRAFGGLDMLVLNAGVFPASCKIEALSLDAWQKVMRINLDSNVVLLREAYPLLKHSPFGGRVLVNASKNVLAPGVGAATYSASKAAVTQIARIAALEWGKDHIRVNMVHPDAIFDTGIWTEEVLKARAANYGLTVQQYKTRNVLGVELNSHYVGELVAEMLGPRFEKITGAQIPVDGGSDRVI